MMHEKLEMASVVFRSVQSVFVLFIWFKWKVHCLRIKLEVKNEPR